MQPLGIYIHWPFCRSKCPYCDFNSHVRQSIDESLWRTRLLQELQYWSTLTQDYTVRTIFFGGGTPSLMSAITVEAILSSITNNWTCDPKVEITLEANPTSIEAQKFKDFRTAGINRVSIGVQSLNDSDLKFLGREHSSHHAIQALEIAATHFNNYSFDLIYARPQQTWDQWQQELTQALRYANNHLSLYQLTIEPNTAFHTSFGRGTYRLPKNEVQAELYDKTSKIMAQHGFDNYEVSNYARPGFECQHNLVYWRYQDYLAIGPGAHGRLTLNTNKVAIVNHRAPETWLNAVAQHHHGAKEKTNLTRQDQFLEALVMGARLREGIPLNRLQQINPDALQHIIDNKHFNELIEQGYINVTDHKIIITNTGRLIIDYILGKII